MARSQLSFDRRILSHARNALAKGRMAFLQCVKGVKSSLQRSKRACKVSDFLRDILWTFQGLYLLATLTPRM